MMRFLTILFFSTFFIGSLFAQTPKEFSKDSGQFIKDLETYMAKNQTEEVQVAIAGFKAAHSRGAFNPEAFAKIQEICGEMLAKKMQPAPYFSKYVGTLASISKKERSSSRIDEFNKICGLIVSDIDGRNFKSYKSYLSFSDAFYNRSAIRESAGSIWRVVAPKYDISYNEKDLLVSFKKVTLVGARKNDSIQIEETDGTYRPFTDIWSGQGGQVSWGRLGIEEVFCVLGKYEFEVKKNSYTCKDATLHHNKYFPGQPIKGTFEDRIIVKSGKTKSTYPRFLSDNKILEIENLGADVKYKGGFRLEGRTVYGYGDKDQKATVSVLSSKSGKPAFTGRSELFLIKEDDQRIVAEGVETSIYFGQDSIYHPSSNLRYEIADKALSVKRGERGSDRNPFFNSYHNINIETDNMDWVVDTDTIELGKKTIGFGGGESKSLVVESYHYFNEDDYRNLQSISTVNPIAAFMAYYKQTGSDDLDANGLAKKINPKFDADGIKSLLYAMVAKGFIKYDEENQVVYIQEKMKHYAKAAVKKTDYDLISITSKTKDTNAYIFLDEANENPIDVQAVKFVEFSPAQKVAMKPMGNQIMVKRNRNMDFNGKLFAGMSVFQGKDFHFNYNDFAIQMDSIRFFDIFENSGQEDENGDPIAYSINSRIEGLSGTLLIDAPNNKSGKEDIEIFPSFSSKGYSYVYYDDRKIQEGVYTRDSFYFRLNEFGLNKLDNYQISDIDFKGKMFSSDIFSPFKERLKLDTEDKSLGFIHKTPSGGYKAYIRGTPAGKGNYEGDVILSNEGGFAGVGTVNYLSASIDSEDIVFRPDNTTCSARTFTLSEQRGTKVEVPEVSGVDVDVLWRPYKDSMYVTPKEAVFNIFKSGLHTFDGTLILTPGGLRGKGLLDWDKASMSSSDMLFGAFSATADTSNLKIKAIGVEGQIAFDTKNVKSDIDFDKGTGNFKANSSEITTSMPYNKYMTSMNEFDWDIKGETIDFKSEPGKLDEFLSPAKDSLLFKGNKALYDLASSTLKIGGVPYIPTADAWVYPETGDVEIQPGGKMTTLENARILASIENKYHVITKATVNVQSGRHYKASGYYEYNVGNKEQEILFSNIIGAPMGKGKKSKKKPATKGSGKVTAEEEFYIDHKTKFQGEISLRSTNRNLEFEGYAQLDMKLPQNPWFSIKSKADKKNLVIEYKKPKTTTGDPLKTGLFIMRAGSDPYLNVMSVPFARKDRGLMDVVGVFKYDKKEDAFFFGDSLRLTRGSYTGNIFEVNNKTRTCTASGEFNVCEGLKFFTPTVVGRAEMKLPKEVIAKPVETPQDSTGTAPAPPKRKTQQLKMDVLAGISYILPEKMQKIMVEDLKKNLYAGEGILVNNRYSQMIPDVVGSLVKSKKAYDQVYAEFKNYNQVKLPKTEKHLFFFSYLPMKWNSNTQSLVSREKMLGLAMLDGNHIHKQVEAYIEFRMPGNMEDGMHMYIKNPVEGGHYYYFKYKNGVLATVSSNPAYIQALQGMKEKELVIKMGKDESYMIEATSPVSADIFVNRVKSAWSNY